MKLAKVCRVCLQVTWDTKLQTSLGNWGGREWWSCPKCLNGNETIESHRHASGQGHQ